MNTGHFPAAPPAGLCWVWLCSSFQSTAGWKDTFPPRLEPGSWQRRKRTARPRPKRGSAPVHLCHLAAAPAAPSPPPASPHHCFPRAHPRITIPPLPPSLPPASPHHRARAHPRITVPPLPQSPPHRSPLRPPCPSPTPVDVLGAPQTHREHSPVQVSPEGSPDEAADICNPTTQKVEPELVCRLAPQTACTSAPRSREALSRRRTASHLGRWALSQG